MTKLDGSVRGKADNRHQFRVKPDAIWANHPQHQQALNWIAKKTLIFCLPAGLGFRSSILPRLIEASTDNAMNPLHSFTKDRGNPMEPLSSHSKFLHSHNFSGKTYFGLTPP
jgi:hypothetical protein